MRKAEIGEIRQHSLKDGGTQWRVKTSTGWKHLKSEGRKFKAYGPDKRTGRPWSNRTANQSPQKPITMPRRNAPNKIARPKPQPMKRTSLTAAEKIAAGYMRVKIDNRTWVLRHPDKIKTA